MKNQALLLLTVIGIILYLLINKQQKIHEIKARQINYCPPKPTATLEKNQLKKVVLNSNPLTVSLTVTNSENQGYLFTAKAKESFLYNKSDDLCLWIYTPDNNLLTQSTIPFSGSYIIQVANSSPTAKNFSLSMGLDIVNSDYRNYLTTTANYNIKSPKTFVINYYQKINEGRYGETWQELAPNFHNLSRSYLEYQEWWQKVQEIKIGRIETLEENENTATVNIELWYLLKSGKEVYDSKKNVHLIWDKQKYNWLIESKKLI